MGVDPLVPGVLVIPRDHRDVNIPGVYVVPVAPGTTGISISLVVPGIPRDHRDVSLSGVPVVSVPGVARDHREFFRLK